MKKIWILFAMLFVPGTLLFIDYPYEINDQELHDLIQEADYIAHSGGGYNGMTYTNSKEAYELALSEGVKLVEFDIHVVEDEILFFHDYADFERNCGIVISSYEEVDGAYGSCPYSQVFIDDVKVITDQGNVVILDVKNSQGIKTYEKIYEILGNDNVVPQVYSFDMAIKLTGLDIFKHLVYRNDDDVSSVGLNHLNPNISMSISKTKYSSSKDYLDIDRKVFLYTINKGELIPGNVGIYTDDYYL